MVHIHTLKCSRILNGVKAPRIRHMKHLNWTEMSGNSLNTPFPTHITYHTSHITYHISHITHHISHIKHHISHITYHKSHITYHKSHITYHITHHISHITHHTSHITYHTSHITHHTSHISCLNVNSNIYVIQYHWYVLYNCIVCCRLDVF